MKLHTTITNENGTVVSKGGYEKLTIGLNLKNKNVATIEHTPEGIKIYYNNGHYWSAEWDTTKGKKKKDDCRIDCTKEHLCKGVDCKTIL